jgi:hypothetical protein
MALNASIKLLSFEKLLFLSLNIPKNKVAVFGGSDNLLVVRHPLKSSNSPFVTFNKYFVVFSIRCSILRGQVIEKFICLLKDLVFKSSGEIVVFFIHDPGI